MELKLKPNKENVFPVAGFLIRGASIKTWVVGVQKLNISLANIKIFAIPSSTPNSIWGCFVVVNDGVTYKGFSGVERCQKVYSNLFIPEFSILYPLLTPKDRDHLLSNNIHVYHPEFGKVELTEAIDFSSYIFFPEERSIYVSIPEASHFIPKRINSFQLKSLSPEEVLKNLEDNVFPKMEKMKDDSLSILEKGKLIAYGLLFNKKTEGEVGETSFLKLINSSFIKPSKGKESWSKPLKDDFKDLNNRNKKEIDKLLDLLKTNPEEALKYAIPLDENGSKRGEHKGSFNLSKRRDNLSLFSRGFSTGGGTVNLGNHYNDLNAQYRQTALDLIKKKEYEKAAFVYLKLLKDYNLAASTLEDGELYEEAASLYLKFCKNKIKSAECYEKANNYEKAINLYKELKYNEKVGDLYLKINDQKSAYIYYEITADSLVKSNKYLEASAIYRRKVKNEAKAQELLMEGWNNSKAGVSCLNAYFSHIIDEKKLKNRIENVYFNKVNDGNREDFLKVIEKEYKRKNSLEERVREIGYEVIAKHVAINKNIIEKLKYFNPNDSEILKDISRFKYGSKN